MTWKLTTIVGVAVCALLTAGCQTTPGPKTEGILTDLANGICRSEASGLHWQAEKSGIFHSSTEAESYAQDLELGGYDDWRLPTMYELYDLHLVFDLGKGGNCQMDMDGNYWIGEEGGKGTAGTWEIADQCEPIRRYYQAPWGYVRAVRP